MLTVIDYLGIRLRGRYGVGRRASAQKSASLVEIDLEALTRQRRRGRESRESSAYDDYARHYQYPLATP